MLRDEATRSGPYSLCNAAGTVTYEPGEVVEIFYHFFSRLYSLPKMLPVNAQKRRDLLWNGVQLRDRGFKISLYADDVLLILTNLHISLPNLHAQLQAFGSLSGYKINTSQTEALPINLLSVLTSLQYHFQYNWQMSSRYPFDP